MNARNRDLFTPRVDGSTQGFVLFMPAGNGVDDAARLQALANQVDGKLTIVMLGGAYTFLTVCRLPSFTKIVSAGNITINSSLANDGNPETACFLAKQTTISSGVPNAPVNVGTQSFGSVTSFNIGDTLIFESNNMHFDYVKIIAKSGAGPFAYNVDKPFSNSYIITDTVASITPPQGIDVDLGGGSIVGTGTRFWEFVLARRCVLRNANLKPTGNMDLIASFDTGSIECGYVGVNVFVPAGLTVLGGLAFESGERGYALDCFIFGPNTSSMSLGIALYDCVNLHVDSCSAYGCVNGLALGADGDTIGCLDCVVTGGCYNGNATGVTIIGGSSRNQLIGVTTQYNGYGVAIAADASTCSGNELIGGKSTGNYLGATNVGIYLFAGAKQTRISSYDVSGNGHSNVTGNGIIVNEDVVITNLLTRGGSTGNALAGSGNGAGLILFQSACSVRLDGFDLLSDPGTAINCIVVPAGSKLLASNGVLRIGASCNGINNSGVLRTSGVTIKPSVASSGENAIVVSAGATRISGDTDLSACATPVFDNTTGAAYTGATNALCNYGQTQANGASPVDVNFSDVHTGEQPVFLIKTAGGTPTATDLTLVSVTAGTKFTWKGAALDTTTYFWRLS